MSAANAVLDELEQRNLLPHADEVGNMLAGQLRAISDLDEGVGQVRGSGLFLAVELVTDRESLEPDPQRAANIVNFLREQRILISASGRYDNVLKIRPPLVFTASQAERLAEGMALALTSTPPAVLR